MGIVNELGRSFRTLRRNPGFAAAVIVTLALGIGANTAVFSVINAALLRPLPYRDAQDLVMIWDELRNLGISEFAPPFAHYFDYRSRNRVFEDIAGFSYADFNLAGERPERVHAMRVTANLLPLLGVSPVLGSGFTPGEDSRGQDRVLLLGEKLWRRAFAADPGVLGRGLELDGEIYTIAGVLPPGYAFDPLRAIPPDVLIPAPLWRDPQRRAGDLRLVARLKPGVSVGAAALDMRRVAAEIGREYRPYRGPQGQDAGYGVRVITLRQRIYGDLRRGLLVLLAAVALVLLGACAGAGNLLLVRAPARRREIALRQALGAGRGSLLRYIAGESLLLVLAGSAAGLVLGVWTAQTLAPLAGSPNLSAASIALDWRVLAFTLAASSIALLLFGLAPALEIMRAAPAEVLKQSARAGSAGGPARQFLIAVQAALCLALVSAAGLLGRSLDALQHVDPGFRPEQTVTLSISLPPHRYADPVQAAGFVRRSLETLGSVREIEAAAVTSRLPLGGASGGDPFSIEGRTWSGSGPVPQVADVFAVSPDYFRALGIRFAAGRNFTERDLAVPVAIVNRTLGDAFFAGNPAGSRILIGAPRPGARWMTIAGVVEDVHGSTLQSRPLPQIYVPYWQSPGRSMTMVLRTSSGPLHAAAMAQRVISGIDPELPVYDVRALADRLDAALARPRFQTLLMSAFAAIALALSLVGVYGVVSQTVARRTREIGVRMALGATPRAVTALALRHGMLPVLAGIGAGVALSLAAGAVLRTLLFGTAAHDPVVLAGSGALLAAAALAACWIPARRAARVDPLEALRDE